MYDLDLPTLGLNGTEYAGGVIRLREWNERVFLHEILHVLLNRWLCKIEGAFDGKPAWEKAVQQVEDALWGMGWRWVSTENDAKVEQAKAEHRHEWADYFERWTGAVGPEPLTVEKVINALRSKTVPFGCSTNDEGNTK